MIMGRVTRLSIMGINNTSPMLFILYYKSNSTSTQETNKYITLRKGRIKGKEVGKLQKI